MTLRQKFEKNFYKSEFVQLHSCDDLEMSKDFFHSSLFKFRIQSSNPKQLLHIKAYHRFSI